MTENLLDTNDKGEQEPSNYFEALTKEGGKFYDPDPEAAKEKVAKGKWEGDRTLKFRESQMDEMRKDLLAVQEELQAKAKLEDMIKDIRELKATSSTTNQNAKDVVSDNKPSFNLEELDSRWNKKLEAFEADKRRTENLNSVRKELQERFGDSYQEKLQQTIKNLELDADYVNDLARRSPKALFKTLGLDQQERASFQAPPKSSQRTEGFAPKTLRQDWDYYQKLKKSNPTAYWDPKTQTQMLKDAIEQGENFKTGDYGKFGDT